jgi:hypothetical protein
MNIKIFSILAVLALLLVSGCGNKNTSNVNTASAQAGNTNTASQVKVSSEVSKEVDFYALEITHSGDPNCFLSACDCQCYPIKNVPLTARQTSCATDCNNVYGVTGCRFTNYQCVTVD